MIKDILLSNPMKDWKIHFDKIPIKTDIKKGYVIFYNLMVYMYILLNIF